MNVEHASASARDKEVGRLVGVVHDERRVIETTWPEEDIVDGGHRYPEGMGWGTEYIAENDRLYNDASERAAVVTPATAIAVLCRGLLFQRVIRMNWLGMRAVKSHTRPSRVTCQAGNCKRKWSRR